MRSKKDRLSKLKVIIEYEDEIESEIGLVDRSHAHKAGTVTRGDQMCGMRQCPTSKQPVMQEG